MKTGNSKQPSTFISPLDKKQSAARSVYQTYTLWENKGEVCTENCGAASVGEYNR